MQGVIGRSRIAVSDSRLAVAWLREALTALPKPWVVLASRHRSGAEGPPWVRYIALHPMKGIALVDVDPTDMAVAPLEDFFEHTGLTALRPGGLPIVAVTLSMDGAKTVVESVEAAFAGSSCELLNPNWCEAVVELLLTTPALCLMPLRHRAPAAPPVLASDAPAAPPGVGGSPTSVAPAGSANLPASNNTSAGSDPFDMLTVPEDWQSDPQTSPQRTWRSWPISPVAALVSLLAVAAILLVSVPTWSPTSEVTNNSTPRLATAAVPPAAKPTTSLVVAAVLPAPAAHRAQPTASPTVPPAATLTATPAHPTPYPVARRHAWWSARRSSPAPAEQRMAVASTRTAPRVACADLLHPDRPGGWNYNGPSVPGCLPIRFFGLIGMR